MLAYSHFLEAPVFNLDFRLVDYTMTLLSVVLNKSCEFVDIQDIFALCFGMTPVIAFYILSGSWKPDIHNF